MKSIFFKRVVIGLASVMTLYVVFSVATLYYVDSSVVGGAENNFRVPPQMSDRHIELLEVMKKRGLTRSELSEYRELVTRRDNEWDSQPFVDELVPRGVENRSEKIRQLLSKRGLSEKEVEEYMSPNFGKDI